MLPRSILPLVVLCFAAACSHWVPVAAPLPLADSTRFTGLLRFTDSLGGRYVAYAGALVRGPSVVYARRDLTVDSVATGSVVRVERRAGNIGGVIGIVVLVALGVLIAVGLAVQSDLGGGI